MVGAGCGAESPLLSVLSDAARHSLLHATAVADAGGITAAVSLLESPDAKTRRQHHPLEHEGLRAQPKCVERRLSRFTANTSAMV
ncbi:unnamed protein product [Closterium sp. NIES-64]|nr:unnamed protein product [Closterium sp. NIES-64]